MRRASYNVADCQANPPNCVMPHISPIVIVLYNKTMPALENPKEEALAQAFVHDPETRFNKKQSYLKIIPTVTEESAEVLGARTFGKVQVQNRVQEILEGELGLTDNYLLNFGRDKFLLGEDQNIAHKAWRTFLEIKGIINQEQGVSIANIVFNEQIIQSAPQAYDDSANKQAPSDNQTHAQNV